jgi:hypothetical protein
MADRESFSLVPEEYLLMSNKSAKTYRMDGDIADFGAASAIKCR